MKNILIIFIAVILFSCNKKSTTPPATQPPVVNTDPVQYGTPFSGVPAPPDADIYQVNMRVFSASGNFAGVTARLDSIKQLGMNVVYLMPIYPVGTLKAFNSPYAVKDYTGVNPEFGTLDDLRTLINKAHSLGMAVILDWVANHTSWDNAWISNKSWYMQDASGNIISPPGTGWTDVAQLNFSNSEMRLAMIKAMKYWVYTANIDGYRCDYADGPPVDFWKQAIDTLRNISTHKLLMLAEGNRNSNFSAGFDFNFGFTFYGTIKNVYRNNAPAISLDDANTSEYAGASGTQRVVRYITNHDVNGSEGSPVSIFNGQVGALGAFIAAAYMKGVPMIYNGQEVGLTYGLPFPFTSIKIDWTMNPQVTAEYKRVIAFRNASNALRNGVLTTYASPDVCVFTKELAGEKVLVLINMRNAAVTYMLPGPLANSTWTHAFTNSTVSLFTQITMPPYGYMVLKQ